MQIQAFSQKILIHSSHSSNYDYIHLYEHKKHAKYSCWIDINDVNRTKLIIMRICEYDCVFRCMGGDVMKCGGGARGFVWCGCVSPLIGLLTATRTSPCNPLWIGPLSAKGATRTESEWDESGLSAPFGIQCWIWSSWTTHADSISDSVAVYLFALVPAPSPNPPPPQDPLASFSSAPARLPHNPLCEPLIRTH